VSVGKPADHIVTTAACDSCHSPSGWGGVQFDHSNVSGTCSSCHNGTKATGKPNGHIATNAQCDSCHTAGVRWSGAKFDHSNAAGRCSSCHNGVSATGKSSGHPATTAQCDSCHTTNSWSGAGFNHDNAAGRCSSCHNGVNAEGKSGNHFVTTAQCDSCHTTNRWSPTLNFRHSTSSYPGDHRGGLLCSDCHRSNSEQIPWMFSAYQPECAACHASDYDAGEHQKTPNTNYSVSELRDCSGACHEYNANGTIRKQRFGKHRASDSGF